MKSSFRHVAAVCVCVLGMLACSQSASAIWVQQQKITAGDGLASSYFGEHLAVDATGTRAVIGAVADNGFRGAVYIYLRTGSSWAFEQKIAGTYAFQQFGSDVDITDDGSRIIVGAHSEHTARIYIRSGTVWSLEDTVVNADSSNQYGGAVAISADGTRAVVGAYGEDTGFTDEGAAYILVRSGSSWSEEQRITASDHAANDYFGHSVAMNGDGSRVIIGASDLYGGVAGAAYVFSRSGSSWSEEQRLTFHDSVQAAFGRSVAIDDAADRVFISAPDELPPALYVFSRSGSVWTEEQKLTAGKGLPEEVSVDDDASIMFVGDPDVSVGVGSAEHWSRSGTSWSKAQEFGADDGASGDYFGIGIDIAKDASWLLVGASSDTVGANSNQGSVYAFTDLPAETLSITFAGTGSGTVTSSPAGIDCTTDCNYDFGQGQVVTLTATSGEDSDFTGWSGDADCSDGQVTMSAAVSCTATFDLGPQLTVATAGLGTGTVSSSPAGISCAGDCSEYYTTGTVVTLTPTPGSGSAFDFWSGDADCADGSVTMSAAVSCTANFRRSGGGSQQYGSLVVQKRFGRGASGSFAAFSYAVSGAVFSFRGPFDVSGSRRFDGVPTGTYSVHENPAAGFVASYGGDCASDGTVTVVPADTVTCTVTNTSSEMPPQPPAPAQYGLHEGDLISSAPYGDPDVYIVNEHGYRRLFLNPVIFGFYGHLGGYAGVRPVIPTTRDAFPISGLFRNCETGDQDVYAVEVTGEDEGTLHHVQLTGDQATAQDPDFFSKVFCINSNEFNWYPRSATPYTSLSQVPVYRR